MDAMDVDMQQPHPTQHSQGGRATITWSGAAAYHEPSDTTICDLTSKSYYDLIFFISGAFHLTEHGLKIKRIVLNSKVRERMPKIITWPALQEFALAKEGAVRLSIETEERSLDDVALDMVGEGLLGMSIASG